MTIRSSAWWSQHTLWGARERLEAPGGEAAAWGVAGLLAGRVAFAAGSHPFGLALVVATLLVDRRAFRWVALGAVLGVGWAGGFWEGAMMFAAAALVAVVQHRWRGGALALLAVAGAVGAVFQGVPGVLEAASPWPGVAMGLLYGGFVMVLAQVFRIALEPVAPWARPAPSGVREGDLALCQAVLAASLAAGLNGITAGPVDLGAVAASLLTVGVAWASGPGPAAAFGATSGVISALGGGTLTLAGALAVGGLLAGLFREWGRLGMVGSFFVGLGLALPLEFGRGLDLTTAAGLAAPVAFLIVPATWLRGLVPQESTGLWSPVQRVNPALVAIQRLRECASLFRDVAQAMAVEGPSATAAAAGEGAARLVEGVAAQTCKGCRLWDACWREDFLGTYHAVVAMAAGVEPTPSLRSEAGAREPPPARLVPPLDHRCIRSEALVAAVGHHVADELRDAQLQRKARAARLLGRQQLRDLAGVIEGLADQVLRPGPRGQEIPKLGYLTAVAKSVHAGSATSGDSHLIQEFDGGRLAVILSDGMGAGIRAAAESRASVSLLRRFLEVGFDYDFALRALNSLLLLRSPEESFATVDLAALDLVRGYAEFVKVGAAPSFLRRGAEVRVLHAPSAPVGILDELDVQVLRVSLVPGDVILMITDGILEARDDLESSAAWVRSFLETAPADDPETLAGSLLDEARAFSGPREHDDMTAVVVRITG